MSYSYDFDPYWNLYIYKGNECILKYDNKLTGNSQGEREACARHLITRLKEGLSAEDL